MITEFEMFVALAAFFMLGLDAGVSLMNERWQKRWKFKVKEMERFYEYRRPPR